VSNALNLTCLPNDQLRRQGASILRVVAEVRDFVEGEDVPESLVRDLVEMERAGRWLVNATSINLTRGIPAVGLTVPPVK
jgi:hypothetical protein